MRIIFMILFLFTLRAQAIDIVFDIDWTLVYTVGKEQAGKRNVFFVEGKYYYLTDGATEIIELLLVDGVDVSFFSGGKRSRNFELLKKIKLSDGRSLYEISKKILSYEELHHVADASPKARFAERLKKDLRLISNDLDNIILVDDIPNFTPTGQEKNIFHLTAYEHFSKFSEVQKNSHLTHKPVDSIDWMLERNKLVWFYSQYSEVKELVRSKNIN